MTFCLCKDLPLPRKYSLFSIKVKEVYGKSLQFTETSVCVCVGGGGGGVSDACMHTCLTFANLAITIQ